MRILLSLFLTLYLLSGYGQCTCTSQQKGLSLIKQHSTGCIQTYESTPAPLLVTSTSIVWIKDTSTINLIEGQVILSDSTDLCTRLSDLNGKIKLSPIYVDMEIQGMNAFSAIVGSEGQLIDFRTERCVMKTPDYLGKVFIKNLYEPFQNATVIAKDKSFWTLALIVHIKIH